MTDATQDFARSASELETFLNKHLPLARAAQVSIDAYSGDCLVASAPLASNINDKGTAFGGSLYNLCVITAWGMTELKAKEASLTGDIVVAKGEINYLRPLRSRLIAKAFAPDSAQLQKAAHGYASKGRAVFNICVEIRDEQQQLCVEFLGKYAVLRP